MNDSDFGGCVIILLFLSVIFSFGFFMGSSYEKSYTTEIFQKQIIERGYGKYTVDNDGNVTFVWGEK